MRIIAAACLLILIMVLVMEQSNPASGEWYDDVNCIPIELHV